jgi:tRNA (guanosine-2'-O-)-methyltransferase
MRRDDPDASDLHALGQLSWPAGWSDDGVCDLLEPLVGPERRARLQQVLAARLGSVTLLLDGPHDPHNVSAVLRSCDAFGVQNLHIVSEEPLLFSRRVAQGTERWLDVIGHASADRALAALRERDLEVVAAHPEGKLLPEQLAELPRVAIVLGNEHRGIAPALLAAAHDTVRIPMQGFVESLNLSVSAAILLHAATRGRAGDLAPHERRHLYARGLFHSVIRAREILDASAPR